MPVGPGVLASSGTEYGGPGPGAVSHESVVGGRTHVIARFLSNLFQAEAQPPLLSMATGLPQLYTSSLRQQCRLPSARMAQVWYCPADRDVKAPAGEFNCPRRLSPQQWRVPSVRNPQV